MRALTKSLVALTATAVIATTSLVAVASASTLSLGVSNKLINVKGVWTFKTNPFTTTDINDYSESFDLERSTITIGKIGSNGRQASRIKTNTAYAGNYKWTSVTVEGDKGRSTVYAPESQRNSQTVIATAGDVGPVYEGKYYSFLYDGSGTPSDYLERSVLTVYKE